MGKSYRDVRRFREDEANDTVSIALSEIFVCDSTWNNLLARDGAQIEQMRQDFENGRLTVRVVVRRRAGGGYNVEDGRHRVIAAKIADAGYIEALVVGS